MSLAFTLFLLIIVFPGFLCRYAFLKGPYSRQNFRPAVSDDIFWSVIPALIIQLSAFQILKLVGFNPSLKNIYLLMVGAKQGIDFELLDNSIGGFLIYTLVLIVVSLMLGYLLRWVAVKFHLSMRYNILKVDNEWYYFLSGQKSEENIDFIQVDVLVSMSGSTTLYSGILEDYYLNKDGGIDRLHLIAAYRNRDYEMPGDYLVIFGREILNLNITYFKLRTDEPNPELEADQSMANGDREIPVREN